MKKLQTFIIILLCVMAGALSASAATFTLVVDHPENVRVGINDLTTTTYPDISSGTAVVTFNANSEQYLEITPAEYVSYTLTLDNGVDAPEVLVSNTSIKDWTWMITSAWAGATVSITTQKESAENAEGAMAVTVNGNIELVNMFIYGTSFRQVTLNEGISVVKFNRLTDKEVYIMPTGKNPFASVTVDDEEIPVKASMDESGNISYQYVFAPKHMAKIVIDTDFAASEYELFVTASTEQGIRCPGFIKSIKANGVAVNAFNRAATVAAGATVNIELDLDNYSLVYYSTNLIGEEPPSCEDGGISVVMNRNWDFSFTVKRINRPLSLTTYTSGLAESGTELIFRNAAGYSRNIANDYGQLKFTDSDNPFTFYTQQRATDENEEPAQCNYYVYLNDEPQSPVDGDWRMSYADGDVLKIYAATEAPALCSVDYSISGLAQAPTIVKDKTVEVTDPARGHAALWGTSIRISEAADAPIASVKVNGEELTPISTGVYEFTVEADAYVVVLGNDATVVGDIDGDNAVTITDLGILVNIITGLGDSNSAADVNGDGKVDSLDLGALVNIIVNI